MPTKRHACQEKQLALHQQRFIDLAKCYIAVEIKEFPKPILIDAMIMFSFSNFLNSFTSLLLVAPDTSGKLQ